MCSICPQVIYEQLIFVKHIHIEKLYLLAYKQNPADIRNYFPKIKYVALLNLFLWFLVLLLPYPYSPSILIPVFGLHVEYN